VCVVDVKLSELGRDCQLVIELDKKTASLVLDDDSPPCDELKVERDDGTSQWLWYWQHDDQSWRSYTEVSFPLYNRCVFLLIL